MPKHARDMQSTVKPKAKEFACSICSLVCSRQDHLERHRKTAHTVRDARTAFPCTECERTFSRRDVLLRHYRVIHNIKCLPRPKGRPKLSRDPRDDRRQDKLRETFEPLAKETQNVENAGDKNNSNSNSLEGAQDPNQDNQSVQAGPGNVITVSDEASALSPGLTSLFPSYEGAAFSFDEDFDQALSLFDWMNEEGASMPYVSGLPDISLPQTPPPVNLSFNSLAPSNPYSDSDVIPALSFNTPQAAERLGQLPTPQTSNYQEDSCSQCSSRHQSGDASSPLTALSQPDPIDRCSASDPWPLEWHASKSEQRVELPILRTADAGILSSPRGTDKKHLSWDMQLAGGTDKLDDSKRLTIVELLSIPFERNPWQENTSLLQSLPNADTLNHFVDLYFLQFHDFWPIIHRPTFKVSQAPTILILSMACIGACYSGLENSIEFAGTLAELCRRTSTWMAEYDTQFVRSPFYGIALLLQHIRAVGSGSRRLLEMADSSRSRLISIGRYMNLFGAPQTAPASTTSPCGQSVYQTWLEWVEKEQIKRLAWFLFEFDCLYTACSKQTPCIKLDETPPELPCENIYWEAPTAYAWSASLSWQQSLPHCQPTTQTIQAFLTESGRSTISYEKLDPTSKRLLMRCLGRILDSSQEQADSNIHNILWNSAGGSGVARAVRSQVSTAIMTLYETVWGDVSHAINLRSNMRVAVAAHYSHMFAAGRIVDEVTKAARARAAGFDISTSTSSLPTDNFLHSSDALGRNKAADDAAFVNHYSSFFNEDPEAVREMVWHASQVFCIQRRYPFNSPHEPLSVFLAGLTLWAFAKFFRPPPSSSTEDGNSTYVKMQLDVPPFCASPETTRIRNEWIKHGGRANLEGAGDLSSPQAPARILALCGDMTQRLKVWGMASKISGVFFRMLQREDEENGLRPSPS